MEKLWSSAVVLYLCGSTVFGADAPVVFARDILPILSDKCFACHGPDRKNESKLRLDIEDGSRKLLDSGRRAIEPGKADDSEMIHRILDPEDPMPPVKSNKTLAADERALLRRWIDQGAVYSRHWAYTPIADPVPPTASPWSRNEIDRFIESAAAGSGLMPGLSADAMTLARRAAFDLTGLPPDAELLASYLNDSRGDAYERYIDALLASPPFGEHMAVTWLDGARYADSNGYLQNGYRISWPWRDWLIKAFNSNMPYDRFLTLILAGDLLPDAGVDEQLPTMFSRLHMINSEGGSIDEEFRIEYAADRSETVGTMFMALTLNCCRCHDHKFDPIGQEDYYRMMALFIDPAGEDPVKDHSRDPAFPPFVRLPQDAEHRALLAADKAKVDAGQDANLKKRLAAEMKLHEDGLAVMVMKQNPTPRQNFVLTRGAYDKPDPARPVEPGGIRGLGVWPDTAAANRLGLAQWLLAPSHPLTARVEVNRLWMGLFGRGLVGTPENFGRQGDYPTHPALLDYLASRLRSSGWDRKAMLRLIATSSTYRQSSNITARHLELDPENRLLTRMPRRRLSGEEIHDQAFFLAGILDLQQGGDPVRPPQPANMWVEGANSPGYDLNHGLVPTSMYIPGRASDNHRRALYTFWNRNAPPPQLLIFDAPDRSSCTVSRSTTNTPLQALVTMNDPQQLEAARSMARGLIELQLDDRQRLDHAFRQATGKALDEPRAAAFSRALTRWRASFAAEPARADIFLGTTPTSTPTAAAAASEIASWTLLCSTILNLDATLVRE